MEPVRSPIERRSATRARCAHLAVIRIGSSVALHALVKDLSADGAKLQLPRDAWLPKSFTLSIPALGFNRSASYRWRRGDYVGLEFDTILT